MPSMPKINVYLPDELAQAVKEAGVPVSAVCQRALEQAVRRVTAIREVAVSDLDDEALAARLPHFTPRARTALALGIRQARSTGARAVGSGHLLAGLLAEGGNLALHVLRAVEIEPERVGRDLAGRSLAEGGSDQPESGPGGGAGPRGAGPEGAGPGDADSGDAGQPERFSSPAANVLELSLTEATAFGHNYVGGEHLLLGLIAEPDGVAGQVLRSLGAELRLTRRAVAAALAGYVHLRAQTGQTDPAGAAAAVDGADAGGGRDGTGAGPAAALLTGAIRRELQPLIQRIARLEEQAGVAATRD